MIRLLWQLAFRNVLRNPRRSFLTVCAIVVGILSANMLAALQRGMGEQIVERVIRNLTAHVQIRQEGYREDPVVEHSIKEFPMGIAGALESEGVVGWSKRVRVPAVIQSERESAGVVLLGIDPQAERNISFIGESVLVGQSVMSENDKGIVIGRALAQKLQTEVGKRVVIMSQPMYGGGVATRGFRVIGLYEAELESTEKAYIFSGIRTVQSLLKMGEGISEIVALVTSRDLVQPLRSKIAAQLLHGFEVTTWRELEPLVVAMVEIQEGTQYVWYVIVMITVSFGLVNSLFMAIFERTREIGLYQALGMKRVAIVWQVMLESLLLITIGAVVGNLLTGCGVWYFRHGIDLSQFAAGAAQFGMSRIVYLKLLAEDMFQVNMVVFTISLLSSAYPAWCASRLDPVDALS